MNRYSEEQIKYHRERWDPQGIHLLRGETIERMEAAGIEPDDNEHMKSVTVQFAEILEKHAKHIRSTEDEILLLIKMDGFGTTFGRLIEEIIGDCKDEHLIDESGDV